MLVDIKDEILNLLERRGVQYGDIRFEFSNTESITVSGEKPEVLRREKSSGYGIRVLYNGAWGFSSCERLNKKDAVATAEKALNIAKAGRKVISGIEKYIPPEKIIAKYSTPIKKDPFSISMEKKLELLTGAAKVMLATKRIKLAKAFSDSFKTKKYFASTTGSLIEQEIIKCGAGILAYAIDNGEVQQRSFPTSFRGNFAASGWEYVENLMLLQNAEKIAEEAAELLKARECPASDNMTLILAPDQMALQIHESIGHPIELDRVFGQEASFAGTSFLDPGMLDSFKYGSSCVNVFADATTPKGLGSFGYDDEGTPAMRFPIIQEGILKNFLSSCGSAPHLSSKNKSNGTARAESWKNIPIIRMTNINLEPGSWDLDDLISDTKNGLLLQTNKSWSIDDKRINFQFGTEIAREIKNGKKGQIYKNPVYSGITPVFWNSCDAVCNERYTELYGIPNCGKGEPMQSMHVGHAASPARFRNVKIGPAR
jgi:TldD protein